jgi:hypothetical protein
MTHAARLILSLIAVDDCEPVTTLDFIEHIGRIHELPHGANAFRERADRVVSDL